MSIFTVNSSILRHFWTVVEDTQPKTLLEVGDAELIEQLMKRLENERTLNREEACGMNAYIRSRLPLIRDLAKL